MTKLVWTGVLYIFIMGLVAGLAIADIISFGWVAVGILIPFALAIMLYFALWIYLDWRYK